jgi:RNA polymerase sigma factor (sigma-70 family)
MQQTWRKTRLFACLPSVLTLFRGNRARFSQPSLADCWWIAVGARNSNERHAEYMEQAPSPEQLLAAVQALDHIARALSRMSTRAQQAFILRHLEGYSHAQIAEQLQVSIKSVQKYLVQALLHCHAAVDPMS